MVPVGAGVPQRLHRQAGPQHLRAAGGGADSQNHVHPEEEQKHRECGVHVTPLAQAGGQDVAGLAEPPGVPGGPHGPQEAVHKEHERLQSHLQQGHSDLQEETSSAAAYKERRSKTISHIDSEDVCRSDWCQLVFYFVFIFQP